MPARVRGWTDLVHQRLVLDRRGARRASASIVLLDPAVIDPEHGWRAAFLIGARARRSIMFFMRLWLPESPRWLMTHGRADEAETDRRRHRGAVRAEGHAIRRYAAAEGAAADAHPHAARRRGAHARPCPSHARAGRRLR